MRIHITDLEHEIAKAKRELEILTTKRNDIDNALEHERSRGLRATRIEIEAEMDEVEDYLEFLEDPDILEPCSSVARAAGCTCTLRSVSPDHPPEPVRSRHCPLHGSEPDEDERR